MKREHVITALVILGIIALMFYGEKGRSATGVFNKMIELPFPSTGVIQNNSQENCVAPFTITTSADGLYFYMRLKSLDMANQDVIIYARKSETVETKIPLGNYQLLYSYGSTWYGQEDLFGIASPCFMMQEIVEMYKKDTAISTMTVTLNVVNGNIQSQPVNKKALTD